MAFEMSLPHAPRIQAVGTDGAEQLAQDEQQWDLYFTVQQALAAQQEADAKDDHEGGEDAGGQEGDVAAAAAKPPQPSDPQKVLEKLLTAKGELDVIVDLVTFVEQQQFLSVAGIHRHPPSLEERVRARCLRLAASKQQLRRAGERLAGAAGALRAQEGVENTFLADLAELRRRWRLRRHAGEGGMFFADISLPLRGAAAQGISQEGAQCNIIQDTNGDACIVESADPGGSKRRAVRGWRHIHAVLEARQQLLTWQVLSQMVMTQARQQRHEADPDGAVAAVQRMLGAAVAACQVGVYAAVAGSGNSSGGSGARAMEVDGGPGSGEQQQAAVAPAAAAACAAETLPGSSSRIAGSSSSLPTMSSMARDIQAALAQPGFQQQFESQLLLLLSQLLPGGSAAGAGSGPAATGAAATAAAAGEGPHGRLFDALLRWLRHAALCLQVSGTLCDWAAAAEGRGVRRVDSGEQFSAVWQLQGCRTGRAAPVLAIAVGDVLRIEGGGAVITAGAAQRQRGLSRAEFERTLLAL